MNDQKNHKQIEEMFSPGFMVMKKPQVDTRLISWPSNTNLSNLEARADRMATIC